MMIGKTLPLCFVGLLATLTTVEGSALVFTNKLDDAPNVMPSNDCGLNFEATCRVKGDGMSEQDCSSFASPRLSTVEYCEHTPLTATLLFNGGDCSQSDYQESIGFSCQEGENASPSRTEGDQSFIVATDAAGKAITYFEGWVSVGSEFVVGNGAEMEHGFLIRVYDSEERTNLLQEVLYGSGLCSDKHELLNRFGAVQLIGYTNKQQGIISPFAAFTYDVSLNLSVSLVSATAVALDSLQLFTSFSDPIDLSQQVHGQQLSSNLGVKLSLPIQIDLTERKQYSLISHLSVTIADGKDDSSCTAISFYKFESNGQRNLDWPLQQS